MRITKLFTAVAVLQCVERGDFALDTRAVEFLPQFAHKKPNFPPGEGCRYNNFCRIAKSGSSPRSPARMVGRE